MFGFFLPEWFKGLPDHLKPTKGQVEHLEALRVSAEMPHPVFFNEVLSSPPTVKKQLHALKQRVHNPDERKAWQAAVRFWVVSMNHLLIGASVSLSESEISAIVTSASDFNDLCERISTTFPGALPNPLDVAKNLGGDYGEAILLSYQSRDFALRTKATIAAILQS